MKTSILRNISAEIFYSFAAAALVLVYYINLPLWRDGFFGTVQAPIIYALLIGAAALSAIFNLSDTRQFLRSKFAIWCIAVLAVQLLNYARLLAFDFPVADVISAINEFQYFLLAPCIAILVFQIRISVFVPLLKVLAVLAPLLIILDFFYPELMRSGLEEDIDKLTEKTRVAGTWFNANAAGEAIVLSLLLVHRAFSRFAMVMVYTFAGFALILTGSRSGMAAFALLGVYFLVQRRLPVVYLIVPILLAIFFSTFLIYVEDIATYFGRESGVGDTINRLEFLSGDGEKDVSSESRGEVVEFAFKLSLVHPIIGHGIDYIDQVWLVGPHNMLAAWTYKYGLIGLLLWLGLGYVLLKNRSGQGWRNPELFVFVWYSFFTHNIMESNYWFIFFALSVYGGLSDVPQKRGSRLSLQKLFNRNKRGKRVKVRPADLTGTDNRRKKRRRSMRW